MILKEEKYLSANRKFKIIAIMDLTDVKKKEKMISINSKINGQKLF